MPTGAFSVGGQIIELAGGMATFEGYGMDAQALPDQQILGAALDNGSGTILSAGNPRLHQLSDYFPAAADPMGIAGGYFGPTPAQLAGMPLDTAENTGHQDLYVWGLSTIEGLNVAPLKHVHTLKGAVWTELGRDDNVELGMLWHVPDFLALHHQVGPCFYMDGVINPLLVEPREKLGLCWNGDIALYASFGQNYIAYVQNEFVTDDGDEGNQFNHKYYEAMPGTGAAVPTTFIGGDVWITVRCLEGLYVWYVNGVAQCAPQGRPTWTQGRDGWGCRALQLWTPVGELYFDPVLPATGVSAAPADHVSPAQVKQWYAIPYEGTF